MAVSFIIDKRYTKADGTCAVKCYIGSGSRLLLPVGVSVPADCFADGKVLKKYQGAKVINTMLDRLRIRYESRILEIKACGLWAEFAKDNKLLAEALQTDEVPQKLLHKEPLVWEVMQRLINRKAPGTARIFKFSAGAFMAYDKDFCTRRMSDITARWLSEFEDHEYARGVNVNSTGLRLKNLRAVFNFAIDQELSDYNPFRRFKIKKEETRHRALTIEEVRLIYEARFDAGTSLEIARQTFLLILFLIGINVTDAWSGAEIVNGRLEYRRAKTKKLYSVKLEPEALALLDSIGRGTDGHLLASMSKYKDRASYTVALDGRLKTLSKRLGLPPISSYWARHTWATLASELDIPKETIALGLGHSIGAPVTSIYIKPDQRKADRANRDVIDYILGKKSPSILTD